MIVLIVHQDQLFVSYGGKIMKKCISIIPKDSKAVLAAKAPAMDPAIEQILQAAQKREPNPIYNQIEVDGADLKITFNDGSVKNFNESVGKPFYKKPMFWVETGNSLTAIGTYGAIIGTNIAGGATGLGVIGLSFADPTGIALGATLLTSIALSLGLLAKKIYDKVKVQHAMQKLEKDPDLSEKRRTALNTFFTHLTDVHQRFSVVFPKDVKEDLNKIKNYGDIQLQKLDNLEKQIKEQKKAKFTTKEAQAESAKKLEELNKEKEQITEKLKTLSDIRCHIIQEQHNKKLMVKRMAINFEAYRQSVYKLYNKPYQLTDNEKNFLIKLLGEKFIAQKISLNFMYDKKKVDLQKFNNYVQAETTTPQDIYNLGNILKKMYRKKSSLASGEIELLKKLFDLNYLKKYKIQ